MTQGINQARLEAVQIECERHIERLSAALRELASLRPLSPHTLSGADASVVRVLDQALYRFTKLQDAMGSRLIPATLAMLAEPYEALSMLDRLDRLEKLGYLKSADRWEIIRRRRNAIAHEYPNLPQVQANNVNNALTAAEETISIWRSWLKLLHENLASSR